MNGAARVRGNATRELSELAAAWAHSAITPAIRERLTTCLIDHFACVLAGSRAPHLLPSLSFVRKAGGREEAWGVTGLRLPAFLSAYINGQAANALDFDDTLLGHPGAAVIPAVFAVVEATGGLMGSALNGILAGYETHWRVARAGLPSAARARHARGVANWDAVAAAVGVSVALAMPAAEIERAIGLAATHTVVPYVAKWYERPVPSVKNNLGWASAAGVVAATMAADGACGVPAAFDGPAGFWAMVGSDRWRWAGEGADAEAVMRVGFKHFPACWHTQGHLVATARLLAQLGVEGAEARSITLTGPVSIDRFADSHPAGSADVAFSLPVLVALLIENVPPGPAWSDPTVYESSRVRRRAASVRLGRGPRRVEIADSRGASHRSRAPYSTLANPAPFGLTGAGVREKFRRLVDDVLGEQRSLRLLSCLEHGDDELPVRAFTELLGARPANLIEGAS